MDPLELAKELAIEVDAFGRRRAATVAVDGPEGSGTSIVADRLAVAIRSRGRTAIRLHGDEFQRARRIRDRRGTDSAEGFLEDTIDIAAIRQLVLEPLARGNHRIVPRIHDPRTDTPVDPAFEEVPDDAVVIMDGQLLLRKELREDWTLRVILTVDEEERLRRAGQGRPGAATGAAGSDRPPRRVRGFALYLERDDPVAAADIVIDTTNVERPVPIRWP
jgi:uridine kinase